MKNIFLFFLMGFFSLGVFAQYEEPFRSAYHFAPKKGWIGDPCGLVYYQDKYHLFWWGKAVTSDFTTYREEAAKAMVGDDGSFHYYTGSVVVDKENTAGFGKNKMIAVYTMTDKKTGIQSQGLSVEGDDGLFHYYEGNPVLDIHSKDFRDPTVFWYEPQRKWVMVVSSPLERKIKFYSSANLKEWKWMSDFGPWGSCENIWECPDIYELPVDGDLNHKRWVLMTSVGPNRGQYFVGHFNGTSFELDKDQQEYLQNGKGLPGKVFMAFDENSYGKWSVEGEAFWHAPDKNHTSVHLGTGMASSYGGSDGRKGTVTSPEFIIRSSAINFLIAGGAHPGQTCIDLLVNDSVVRSTTGDNSSYLKWKGWKVTDLQGMKAKIRIKDDYDGTDWGYINVDHILFSDRLFSNDLEHTLWIEAGADFYAARAFKDYQGTLDKTVWMAWMNNWDYARGEIPASRGRGFWSIPRAISLQAFPEGIRMVQQPVGTLQDLRGKEMKYTGTLRKGSWGIPSFKPKANCYEMDVTFTVTGADEIGLNLCVGDGRSLPIRYDSETSLLSVNRMNCTSDTIPRFNRAMNGCVPLENGKLHLRIFVDKSSVEVFAGSGQLVFSLLTFPGENQNGVELFSKEGRTTKVEMRAWEMKSVWK